MHAKEVLKAGYNECSNKRTPNTKIQRLEETYINTLRIYNL